jgi:uncharacterized protein YdaT
MPTGKSPSAGRTSRGSGPKQARTIYVVGPDGKGGWKGEKAGAKRASVAADTKKEAIERTRPIAKRQGASMKIQKKDGTFQEERTYSPPPDPYPPKG